MAKKTMSPSKEKSVVKDYPPHALCLKYRDMTPEEFRDLKEGMRKHGFDPNQPIVLLQDTILDGRHRYKSAKELGLVPVFREYGGEFGTPEAFVEAYNKNRRHLSTSERAMQAAEKVVEKVTANLQKSTSQGGNSSRTVGLDQAVKEEAAKAKVGTRTVYSALTVQKHGTTQLKEAVKNGQVSTSDAAKIAKAPKSLQEQALKAVAKQKAVTAAQAVKAKEEVKDALGNVVPDKLRDTFATHLLEDAIDAIALARKNLKEVWRFNPWISKASHAVADLEQMEKLWAQAVPHALCDHCRGKGCQECRGSGFFSVFHWKERKR